MTGSSTADGLQGDTGRTTRYRPPGIGVRGLAGYFWSPVAVIVRGNNLLTIHRRKNGAEYYTLPGGGVEEGESVEEACAREVQEETGLTATVGKRLLVLGNEYYFAADAPTGEPQLGGEEDVINSPENQYTLICCRWMSSRRPT